MNNNADCYKCKHRGNIEGNTHNCCNHPLIGDYTDLLVKLVRHKGNLPDEVKDFNIVANSHGVKQGWFFWPMDFDPVWLNNCDKFETK